MDDLKQTTVEANPAVQVTTTMLVVQGAIFIAVAFALLFIGDWIFGRSHLTEMLHALVPTVSAIALGTVLGVPFFFFGEGCRGLCVLAGVEQESSENLLTKTGVAGNGVRSFASGLAEEILIRGALQPFIGLFPASLLFGVMHMTSRRAWPYALRTFIYGCLFGAMYAYTGSLWVSIMAHVVNNFLSAVATAPLRATVSGWFLESNR